jgi:hypothetical protein
MPKGTQRRSGIPFAIPPWVPQGAADNIAWRAMLPGMKARDLALLERLATADAMRAVWPKLAAVDTNNIVSVILRAEEEASSTPPPLPKRTKDLAVYLQKTRLIPPSFVGVAVLVEKAMQDMQELEVSARAWLPYLWPGEPDMTFDRLLMQLNATAEFCRRLDAENKIAAEADPLPPPPRKRGSSRAKQTYFGLILSDYFKRIGGSPLDDVVATITGVVFDDAFGGPGAETVRGRRRWARQTQSRSNVAEDFAEKAAECSAQPPRECDQ